MRDNRKWFDDENKVRGKGETAPFDSDLDVLDLSPAEWKDVDAELALCKGGKRKYTLNWLLWPVSDSYSGQYIRNALGLLILKLCIYE
jgi:hypothetical protein